MKRKKQSGTVAAVADYIIEQIDATDWQTLLEQHRYCSQCPARCGGVLDEDDAVNDLCLACPLRPLMLDIAQLVLRKRRQP